MRRKKSRKHTFHTAPQPVIDHDTVREYLRQVQQICDRERLGFKSAEYSLKCQLAALNGNWPRIKRVTWDAVLHSYQRLVIDRDVLAQSAGLRKAIAEEKVVEHTAKSAPSTRTVCELCLSPAVTRFVKSANATVCRLCAKQFWPEALPLFPTLQPT